MRGATNMERYLRRLACLCLFACALDASQGVAQVDKFQLSEAEKAACTPDAERFCSGAYPDEDKLLSCMKAKRKALTSECRVAFDTGLKKRGLN